MKNHTIIHILLLILIIKSKGAHSNITESNIFVKFNHAEANFEPLTATTQPDSTTATEPTTVFTEPVPVLEDVPDTIVFVPNDRPIQNDDYNDSNLRIKDIMMMKTAGDAVDQNFHLETESPAQDILFISGKNTEFNEEPAKKRRTDDGTRRSGIEKEKSEKIVKIKLNCTDLDCNNTVRTLCGGKKEHNTWKYRLFLNDCYYRKVNCNFNHVVNRYKLVSKEKCSKAHDIAFYFKPKPYTMEKTDEMLADARRSSSSRRSLTMGVSGQFCSHSCPVSCPNDYDPECAVSATGQRRVFLNHCKLDFNSCSYGVVWHRRPLAECVGGKKADLRQNRGFIDWMQRVGMVDKKGRLSLD